MPIIIGFRIIAVAIRAEYRVREISPELSKMNWTIRLVLNLTPSPTPSNKEYLVPSIFRKTRNDAESFETFATTKMRTINKGEMKREVKETFVPMLRKKSGERKT